MARRRHSNRRHRGGFSVLYKLLSILIICTAIIVALTLFFRVDTIVVSGQERYTSQEIQDATGIAQGDNLFLLNKYDVAQNIVKALPYVEEIRISRKLPDTLLIEVRECGTPLALVQDGSAWLISPGGKIVEQKSAAEVGDSGIIDGCKLLAPSVGTPLALATEYADQQTSLLELLAALEDAGMLKQVDAIHLDDAGKVIMDYAGRFTVEMPYNADYAMKLKALRLSLESGKIQDNMTGTFDLMQENGDAYFRQNTR